MAAGDDGTDDYVASFGLSATENKQIGDVLSAEVAWADSCLVVDSVSDSSWESLKDSLFETLRSESDSASSEKLDLSKEVHFEVVGLHKEEGSSQNWHVAVDNNASTSKAAENMDEDHNVHKNDTFWSRVNMERVFDDSPRDAETFESDIGLTTFVIDQIDEDLFKVSEEPASSHNWDKEVNNNALTSEGPEKTDDDRYAYENGDFWSRNNMEKVFRPTYNENLRHIRTSVSDFDLGITAFVIDQPQSYEDIFKVWDLDTPDEEDELIQQLNKALRESSSESSPAVSGDSKVLEVDDIVSSLADLSLIENSV